ncbi:MAG: GAF domain-containing protein [Armatimonadota bacterium]|nr:GAF domain-containing protein [Armatimonadota bacterium]
MDSGFGFPHHKCASEAELLARLSRLVTASPSSDEVLQRILDDAVLSCAAVRGFLAIVDHDRGALDVRYVSGQGWTEQKRLARLKASEETGRGITSLVAATGKPYRSGNVLEDPHYVPAFEDVRSEIAVPLIDAANRIRGVINLESSAPNAFDDSHECLLRAFADLAVISLTIADHRARESALVEIGKELNRFGDTDELLQRVIDVASEALRFEDCSLFLIDVATDKLVLRASRGPLAEKIGQATYDLGEGLTGWTAQHGVPVRVSDPPSDPRWRGRFEEIPASEAGAYMAVPIKIHRGVIGVIRVQRRKSPYDWLPNDFTDDDERMLSTIASQLGIALDNRRLVDQLVKAERMAAWGEMSARSAHMIGNRVFAIKGDINELEYLLKENKIDPQRALEILESIKKGIFLLEEVLNEFREFVKATQLELEEADLNDLVKQAIDEGFPKRSATKLTLNLAPKLPKIKADPKKLKRCFTEIIENAINFQPDGGEIKISTSLADARSKKWLRPSQQSGSYVQVRFEDTGPGIDLDKKPKIFNPFYSTRAKGMGLGLSIVKGIVEAHNGTIYENGIPGKGARFTILLPYEKEKPKGSSKDAEVEGE